MRILYFRLAIVRQLKQDLADGKIDQETHDKVRSSLSHKRVCKIMHSLNGQGYGDVPQVIKAIWSFVVQNWPTILKIAISLLALMENEDGE